VIERFADGYRRWLLRKLPPGPLRDYCAVPLPRRAIDYRQIGYVALDFETTGLNPRRDHILSLGWVVVENVCLLLGTAEHRIIRLDCDIPAESAAIHRITDDQSATGETLNRALAALFATLTGRVLIVHHASIERGFLAATCRRLYGYPPPLRIIDTEVVARRVLDRRQIIYQASELRLHALAERYNLPRLNAHNALSDAIVTAELFLAQTAYQDAGRGFPLGDLLC